VKELFSLEYKSLISGQWWRLITFSFSFIGLLEYFIGWSLLYYFRVLERQLGTPKYGVFVLISFTVSSILSISLIFIHSYLEEDSATPLMFSGPYGLIFSALVLYYYYIPALVPIPFFGIRFNDKIFIYLAAIILFLSHPPSTIYYSFCGIFSGLLYLTQFDSLELPNWICRFCEKYFGPILSISPSIMDGTTTTATTTTTTTPPQLSTAAATASSRRPAVVQNVFDFDTVHTYYSSPQLPRQPSPQHIEYLISMGVERERAIQVLMRCDDELNIAIENLFPTV